MPSGKLIYSNAFGVPAPGRFLYLAPKLKGFRAQLLKVCRVHGSHPAISRKSFWHQVRQIFTNPGVIFVIFSFPGYVILPFFLFALHIPAFLSVCFYLLRCPRIDKRALSLFDHVLRITVRGDADPFDDRVHTQSTTMAKVGRELWKPFISPGYAENPPAILPAGFTAYINPRNLHQICSQFLCARKRTVHCRVCKALA